MIFTNRPKWKRVIVAMICVVGLLAVAGGTYAAYSSQASQRGVARNNTNETVRFASNLLQTCVNGTASNNYASKMVYFSENQKTDELISMNLDIFNYANGNTNLVNQKDITYNLIIKFDDASKDNSNYQVFTISNDSTESKVESNSLIYNLDNQTLIGRNPNSRQYVLKFPGVDLDKLKITVTAVPTNLSVTNNQILAAVIRPCVGSITQSFGYNSEFIRSSDSDKPIDYDGFNYEIRITSGQATGTLTWRNDIVEIDPFTLEKLGKNKSDIKIDSSDKNRSVLIINMDQSAGKGDYLIPFYIVDKSMITDETVWKDADETNQNSMKKIITFIAEEKTTE